LKNADYAALLNVQKQKQCKKPTVMPLLDEPLGALPDDSEDEVTGPAPKAPKPLTRPAPPRPVRATRRKTSGGDRDPPPVCPPGTAEPIPIETGCGPGRSGKKPSVPSPSSSHPDDGSDDVIGPAPPEEPANPRPPLKDDEVSAAGLTDGTFIVYCDYRNRKTGKAYPNFVMYCSQCPGGACHRTRGDLDDHKTMAGDIEPLAFLHVWECMELNERKHNLRKPRAEAVAQFAEEHRGELTELRALLVG